MKLDIHKILFFIKKSNITFEFEGDNNLSINTYSSLFNPINDSILFARNLQKIDYERINQLKNSLIIINKKSDQIKINYIIADDPHQVFFMIVKKFFVKRVLHHISPNSVILSRNISKSVSIGNGTFIDKNVVIEDEVVIKHNVTITGHVYIGKNTTIESNTSIGVDGFGHFKNNNNVYIRVDHLAGVNIGKNVIIGSNTTIARGALTDTVIEDNVRIDNLCHIAHNVVIKARSMLTACVEISGSSIVEEDVWIGPNSSIINGITIGRGSKIGIGSVVIKNVPTNSTVFGNPAKIIF